MIRGIETPLTEVRREVFSELARIAFEGKDLSDEIEKAVFKIIPGEVPKFRDSVFKERAIVGERIRLALGLPLRKVDEQSSVSKGSDYVDLDERIYLPPLVNIISFACDACEEKSYEVTNNCRKCVAHPCKTVCPVDAVTFSETGASIDKKKCIRCGKCKSACPFSAIINFERPCEAACGVKAIDSDELGRSVIDREKCVSCGMCMISCPFGAIADKSQVFQLSKALSKKDTKICAMIAPSFYGQFGDDVSEGKLIGALKELGFHDVYEVSLGADIVAMSEADEFLNHVPEDKPFLGTSCCPTWAMAAKKNFPELKGCISSSSTPMGVTARIIRNKYEDDCKIAFIGPCIAKKLEALNEELSPYVDFVVTYEELMGMFVGKNIDFSQVEEESDFDQGSFYGRDFAAAGGVAQAVAAVIKEKDPKRIVPIDSADGLSECIKLLKMAKAGRKDGYLLEGMGCPGGCVGGPGTLLMTNKGKSNLTKFSNSSNYKLPSENKMAVENMKFLP